MFFYVFILREPRNCPGQPGKENKGFDVFVCILRVRALHP